MFNADEELRRGLATQLERAAIDGSRTGVGVGAARIVRPLPFCANVPVPLMMPASVVLTPVPWVMSKAVPSAMLLLKVPVAVWARARAPALIVVEPGVGERAGEREGVGADLAQ